MPALIANGYNPTDWEFFLVSIQLVKLVLEKNTKISVVVRKNNNNNNKTNHKTRRLPWPVVDS